MTFWISWLSFFLLVVLLALVFLGLVFFSLLFFGVFVAPLSLFLGDTDLSFGVAGQADASVLLLFLPVV